MPPTDSDNYTRDLSTSEKTCIIGNNPFSTQADMSKKASASKITFAAFKVHIAKALSGFLVAESLYLTLSISRNFINKGIAFGNTVPLWLFCLLYIGVASIITTYYWARGGFFELRKFLLSFRIDILFCFLLGAGIVVYFGGIGQEAYNVLAKYVPAAYISAGILSSLGLATISLLGLFLQSRRNPARHAPLFISDSEIKDSKDDLLDLAEKANHFAERLYNSGSRDSIVFGIDAPWGIGKSSFLNFCTTYLEEKHGKKVVIYRFDPLKHEDPAVLQEKFISGLVKAIQTSTYIPEISSLMSRYSKILKGKIGLRFFGLSFEPNPYSVEEAFDDLQDALTTLDKKVIIVIDDLDRLDFGTVKDILFTVKKSFALPNLSYVLCYDTENIADLDDAPDDKEKVREFLEKFVNVKLSIFLSSTALANYVSKNFAKALSNNQQIDPLATQKLMNAIEGIKDIFESTSYHEYRTFLNDVRKLKRLINLIISLDIDATDFVNTDINNSDLIHLLLIYINYPNVFRKIYDTEMDRNKGFFSLVGKHDEGFPHAADNGLTLDNSKTYHEYVKDLAAGPKFLLHKIFDAKSRFADLPNGEPNELARYTYAAFNGRKGGKNLQMYLNLIANLSKPKSAGQYKFYLQMIQLWKGGTDLSEVLSRNEFKDDENEVQELWKVIVNSARELTPTQADGAIEYLVNSLPRHSFIERGPTKVGARSYICRYLAVMLDRAGWFDKAGGHIDNTEQHIAGIADWIFGEKGRISIIERLMSAERGALGIYDALLFRLQCGADRDGNLFNLSRALSLHSNPPGPISGDVRSITIGGLREISQKIYTIFRDYYVLPKHNFLKAVEDLDLTVLAGDYFERMELSTKEGASSEATLSELVTPAKSHIISFCIYQLGSSLIDSGVGCGYYDRAGMKDSAGIRIELNSYLFDICFNPKASEGGFIYFIDYLLLCFDFSFEIGDSGGKLAYQPTLEQFLKVLDRDCLSQYWNINRRAILDSKFESSSKKIVTSNYSTSYADGLPAVYRILDKLSGL